MAIPNQIVDRVRETALIEEVIGEFVDLKKSGSNYKGLSPFTEEKTPSFVVSPSKQIFKCFSSNKGGNVFSFLMEHEHMSFVEAVKWVAKKYNVEIPEEREQSAEEIAKLKEKEALLLVNKAAKDFFRHELLGGDEGVAVGKSYLKERGIRDDISEKFELGWCPSQGGATFKHLRDRKYKKDLILKTGLCRENDRGPYDFYRDRIIFPIHSLSGQVIGFGGRTLKSDKRIPKYINTPENPIYDKSRVLYGIHLAKNEMAKQENCYLCEGYMDVIAMHQAGVNNTVSASGTAFTQMQAKLIKRFTKNVTVVFDGDAAGIKAALRGVDIILEEGMNVRVVVFPQGDDPDSFAQTHGQEALHAYLKDASMDLIAFKAQVELEGAENDPVRRAEAMRSVVQSIAKVPDSIMATVFLREAAVRFDVPEQTLVNEYNKLRRDKVSKQHRAPELRELPVQAPPEPQPSIQVDPKGSIHFKEWELVRLLMLYANDHVDMDHYDEEGKKYKVDVRAGDLILHEMERDDLLLEDPLHKQVLELFSQVKDGGDFPNVDQLLNHSSEQIRTFATDAVATGEDLSENWQRKHGVYTNTESMRVKQAVMGALYSLKIDLIRTELVMLRETFEDEGLARFAERHRHLSAARMAMAKMTGRVILE